MPDGNLRQRLPNSGNHAAAGLTAAARPLLCLLAMKAAEDHLPLIERIERALVLLACFIEMDGDVHVPVYERLEAELEELRRREGTKDRARRLLASYTRAGGVKAIPAIGFNGETTEAGARPAQ